MTTKQRRINRFLKIASKQILEGGDKKVIISYLSVRRLKKQTREIPLSKIKNLPLTALIERIDHKPVGATISEILETILQP